MSSEPPVVTALPEDGPDPEMSPAAGHFVNAASFISALGQSRSILLAAMSQIPLRPEIANEVGNGQAKMALEHLSAAIDIFKARAYDFVMREELTPQAPEDPVAGGDESHAEEGES